jgi:hypothetical protein
MKENTYYRVTEGIGWTMLILGLIEAVLWAFGLLPNYTWQRLAEPVLWANIILMVRIIRQRDEIIDVLQRQNQKLVEHCDELNHRLEDPANRINE